MGEQQLLVGALTTQQNTLLIGGQQTFLNLGVFAHAPILPFPHSLTGRPLWKRQGVPFARFLPLRQAAYDSGNLIVQPIDLVTVGSISSPLASASIAVRMYRF